jgi:hypothetical protein
MQRNPGSESILVDMSYKAKANDIYLIPILICRRNTYIYAMYVLYLIYTNIYETHISRLCTYV